MTGRWPPPIFSKAIATAPIIGGRTERRFHIAADRRGWHERGGGARSGARIAVNCQNDPDWYTARRVGAAVYGYKTLIEEGSGRILGAHLVGPHVDDVINLFAHAIRRDLTAEDLRQTIFAYPTGAYDIGSMLYH